MQRGMMRSLSLVGLSNCIDSSWVQKEDSGYAHSACDVGLMLPMDVTLRML